MTTSPTLVLGGGPAGLCAAWRLAEAGHAVEVVETEHQPGGLCMTVERDGFRFDLGGHRLISSRAEWIDRLRSLMGPDLLERERRSRIVLDGQRFAYPLEARDLAGKLPLGTVARAGAGYLGQAAARKLRPRPVASFEDWTVARFGRPLYDLFFGPYTEKLWGLPPSELSADWAAQRISLMNLGDVALRLARLRRGGSRTCARRYLYPRHGIGMLFERLLERLQGLGVRFRLGATATGLEREGERITGVQTAAGEVIPCGQVISTIPLQALATALEPEVEATARRLRFRGVRFLNVALEGPPLLAGTWYYVADGSFTMTRVPEPLQRSPEMAPAGHTGAMLEIPCDPGSELWEQDDQALLRRIEGEMDTLGLPIRDRSLFCFSTRAAHAYPVYSLTYRRDRQALLDVIDRVPNLHSVGRQGLFRYVFMDTAMEMGWQAAGDVIAGRLGHTSRAMAIDQDNTLIEITATTA